MEAGRGLPNARAHCRDLLLLVGDPFDIPEIFKKNRDGFAANLKHIGFVQIQKSAFAFPYPCGEELEVLADFHQVTNFIHIIVADSISNDNKVKKHFSLKNPK